VLVDLWLSSYAAPPKSVTLDIDDTVDVVHGHQQLSLFNAHMWNGPLGKCIFQTADHAGTVRSYVRPFSAVM
jgi:hypothetical protein